MIKNNKMFYLINNNDNFHRFRSNLRNIDYETLFSMFFFLYYSDLFLKHNLADIFSLFIASYKGNSINSIFIHEMPRIYE